MLSAKYKLLDFIDNKLSPSNKEQCSQENQQETNQGESSNQESSQQETQNQDFNNQNETQNQDFNNQNETQNQDFNSNNQQESNQGESNSQENNQQENQQETNNQQETQNQDSNNQNKKQSQDFTNNQQENSQEESNQEENNQQENQYNSQGKEETQNQNQNLNYQPYQETQAQESQGQDNTTLNVGQMVEDVFCIPRDTNDEVLDGKNLEEIKALLNGDLETDIDDGVLDEKTYEDFKQLINNFNTSSILKDLTNEVTLEVNPTKKVSIRWWNDLVKLFKTLKPIDTSFKRLNKKLQYMDIKLPTKSGNRKKSGDIEECHIYLDVSGSMSKQDLDVAMSTTKVSRKYFKGSSTKFFTFTTKLKQYPVSHLFTNKINPGGGTDIEICLKNVYKNNRKIDTLNIFISDGCFEWKTVAEYAKVLNRTYLVFLVTNNSSYTINSIVNAGLLKNNKYVKIYFAVETGMVDWVLSKKLKDGVEKLYG